MTMAQKPLLSRDPVLPVEALSLGMGLCLIFCSGLVFFFFFYHADSFDCCTLPLSPHLECFV